MVVPITFAESSVFTFRSVLAESQSPVLALVCYRVLVFPSCAAYKVERDGFQFVDGHTSALLLFFHFNDYTTNKAVFKSRLNVSHVGCKFDGSALCRVRCLNDCYFLFHSSFN